MDVVDGPHELLQKFQPLENKRTLSGALVGNSNFHEAKGDMFRLLYLRVAPDGCDKRIIRNHVLLRARVHKQFRKWHDYVRNQIAMEKNQKSQGVIKQSRQSAWISHCEKVRAEFGSSLPSCLVLSTGNCVAVWFNGMWKVAVVMSIWRIYKKGSGAQLHCQEIGRGGVHSARVVLASQPKPEMPGLFVANAACASVVIPATSIGLRLDIENMDCKRASDALQFILPQAHVFFGFFLRIVTLTTLCSVFLTFIVAIKIKNVHPKFGKMEHGWRRLLGVNLKGPKVYNPILQNDFGIQFFGHWMIPF